MSKRTRGSARTPHRRPGTRPATIRTRQRTDLERAPEIAERMLATEEPTNEAATHVPAPAAERRTPAVVHGRTRVKPGSLLAARAANEYVYVAQDLKRILLLGGVLFAALVALWLLIVVLRVIPLPFY